MPKADRQMILRKAENDALEARKTPKMALDGKKSKR